MTNFLRSTFPEIPRDHFLSIGWHFWSWSSGDFWRLRCHFLLATLFKDQGSLSKITTKLYHHHRELFSLFARFRSRFLIFSCSFTIKVLEPLFNQGTTHTLFTQNLQNLKPPYKPTSLYYSLTPLLLKNIYISLIKCYRVINKWVCKWKCFVFILQKD